MRATAACFLLVIATSASAQMRHVLPSDHVLRNGPGTSEAEAPQTAAPVNLRPTLLVRCSDGKGGFLMQDTPCKEPAASAGAAPAPVGAVTDLSSLPPRQQVPEAPPPRVEPTPSRWTKGLLGAGKLALILAAVYAVYRVGRYARDRFRQRFGEPEPVNAAPRRIH